MDFRKEGAGQLMTPLVFQIEFFFMCPQFPESLKGMGLEEML